MLRTQRHGRAHGCIFGFALFVGSMAVAAGCSSVAAVASEGVESSGTALLSMKCSYDASNNLSLKVMDGEVAYVGFQPGCTVEPCVVSNAVDNSGNACKVASSGKSITITGGGGNKLEKVILDYSGGLFAKTPASATTPLVTIALDTSAAQRSQLFVMSPKTGGNMAAGVSGIDLDTTSGRAGGAKLDVKVTWSTTTAPGSLTFQGGAGPDVFTADAAGWTTAPVGWDTAANLTKVVGAAVLGALTASGGAGDDILAGGAGANTLLGGDGNDTFLQASVVHAELMIGEEGIDTVDYGARTANLSITLDGTGNDGAAGELDNVKKDVEIVKGGSGNDTLDASAIVLTDVVLMGGPGNDVLIGGGGNDDLCGGPGNDRLKWSGGIAGLDGYGGLAGDWMIGGTGLDTVDYSNYLAGGVEVCLGGLGVEPCNTDKRSGPAGQRDLVNEPGLSVCPRAALTIDVLGTPSTSPVSTSGIAGVITSSVDVENVTGASAFPNELHCGPLACTAIGGSGDDTIVGSSYADALFGNGSLAGDRVSTGGGNDLIDLHRPGGTGVQTQQVTCTDTDHVTIVLSVTDTVTLTTCNFVTIAK